MRLKIDLGGKDWVISMYQKVVEYGCNDYNEVVEKSKGLYDEIAQMTKLC
jgi:hypothetical protein